MCNKYNVCWTSPDLYSPLCKLISPSQPLPATRISRGNRVNTISQRRYWFKGPPSRQEESARPSPPCVLWQAKQRRQEDGEREQPMSLLLMSGKFLPWMVDLENRRERKRLVTYLPRILQEGYKLLRHEPANLFCKSPGIKYLGFVAYAISVATTQLCPWIMRAATDNTRMSTCGCVPIEFSL